MIFKKHTFYYMLVIFIAVFSVYMSNNRVILTGDDTIPMRYLPVSILTEFNLDLDEFSFLSPFENKYFFKESGGHYYSLYPVGTAILALPVYGIAKIMGLPFTGEMLCKLEKVSAALIVTVSVILLFLTLKELIVLKESFLLTFIYAFATCSWSVSSQALWQHGAGQLFNILSLYFIVKGIENTRFIPFSGLAAGLGICIRPTNIFAGLIISCYVVYKYRNKLLEYSVYLLIPVIFLFYYNYSVFHHLWGGYKDLDYWQNSFFTALCGLLLSPSRGLFIYTPVLIFSFAGIYKVWRAREHCQNSLFLFISFIPLFYITFYSTFSCWYGGGCFGPRFFNDILPFFVILMVPYLEKIRISVLLKTVFIILVVYSVYVQVLGVYFDDNSWNARPNINYNTQRLWQWKNSQLAYIMSGGRVLTTEKKEDKNYYSVDGKIDFRSFESEKCLGYCWAVPEVWGIWSIGNESTLFVSFLKKSKKINIVIKCTSFENQQMKVYINGNFLKEIRFEKPLWEWSVYEMQIPPEFLNSNIEEIKFMNKISKRASYSDLRRISVGFEYIKFTGRNK